jgi:phosphatidate cytidylyltransferase
LSQARHTAGRAPEQSAALDWVMRPVFGVLMAAATVGAAYLGGAWFALLIGIAVAAAAREWHRMFARAFAPYMVVTIIAVAAALTASCGALRAPGTFPWVALMAGTIANFSFATLRREEAAWQGFGVLYLGLSAVAIVMLRMGAPEAFWLVVTLFACVWATDTGALVFGNLVGGPKLAPVLSPNKTWSGLLGGIVCAVITGSVIVAALGGDAVRGGLFGLGVSLAAHAGDLFESWVKRRVGRKSSGSLIPGHGGVLDRIDSTIMAAPVCALAVLVLGLNPLLGVNP